MTGPRTAEPHQLTAPELDRARALVRSILTETPYLDRALELVDESQKPTSEIVAFFASTTDSAALLSGGLVAGSQGVWQIRSVIVGGADCRELGRALIQFVISQARDAGARLVVAELPADEVIGDALSLLRASGFRQDGRIADYFRDGVALLFLRLTL